MPQIPYVPLPWHLTAPASQRAPVCGSSSVRRLLYDFAGGREAGGQRGRVRGRQGRGFDSQGKGQSLLA